MWEVRAIEEIVKRLAEFYNITKAEGDKMFDLIEALADREDPTNNPDDPQEMMRIAITDYEWWRYKPHHTIVEVANLRAVLKLYPRRKIMVLIAIVRRDETTYDVIEKLWRDS